MRRHSETVVLTVLAVLLLLVGVSVSASAQGLGPVHRLSSEFQFAETLGAFEIITTLPPAPAGAGGKVVYSKTLFSPGRTLFVTFSGTGDVHNATGHPDNALLMTCQVDGVVCNSGSGLPTAGPSGWITLLKPPPLNPGEGCSGGFGDGGGGGSDCHDNNINYVWCTNVAQPGQHTVELKLAAANGLDPVFYERAHIYIDGTPNKNAEGCVGAAVVPGSTTLP